MHGLTPCPRPDCPLEVHHWHFSDGLAHTMVTHPPGDPVCFTGALCFMGSRLAPSPEPLLGVTTVALMIEDAVRQALAGAAA